MEILPQSNKINDYLLKEGDIDNLCPVNRQIKSQIFQQNISFVYFKRKNLRIWNDSHDIISVQEDIENPKNQGG